MSKWILTISVNSILTIATVFYLSCNNRQLKNEMSVTVGNSLSIEKIKIEYGFYSMHSRSDENLVNEGLDDVIFTRNQRKPFETVCGENDFYITYDSTYYSIMRHIILNDFVDGVPSPHTYEFSIQKQGNKLYVTLEIEGEYPCVIINEMQSITKAKHNVWGRPEILTSISSIGK